MAHGGDVAAAGVFHAVSYTHLDVYKRQPEKVVKIPEIPAARVAARLFTSGSTGLPLPHDKTWGGLARNGRAGARRLGMVARPHAIVATVQAQHRYRFESTVLLTLHGN